MAGAGGGEGLSPRPQGRGEAGAGDRMDPLRPHPRRPPPPAGSPPSVRCVGPHRRPALGGSPVLGAPPLDPGDRAVRFMRGGGPPDPNPTQRRGPCPVEGPLPVLVGGWFCPFGPVPVKARGRVGFRVDGHQECWVRAPSPRRPACPVFPCLDSSQGLFRPGGGRWTLTTASIC